MGGVREGRDDLLALLRLVHPSEYRHAESRSGPCGSCINVARRGHAARVSRVTPPESGTRRPWPPAAPGVPAGAAPPARSAPSSSGCTTGCWARVRSAPPDGSATRAFARESVSAGRACRPQPRICWGFRVTPNLSGRHEFTGSDACTAPRRNACQPESHRVSTTRNATEPAAYHPVLSARAQSFASRRVRKAVAVVGHHCLRMGVPGVRGRSHSRCHEVLQHRRCAETVPLDESQGRTPTS